MAKIIGAFAFTNEGDGCLTAKWINNDELTPYPEACKLISKDENAQTFEGTYTSTWIETGTTVQESLLTITRLPSGVYDLLWINNRNQTTLFTGRAMLHREMLIGSYWD